MNFNFNALGYFGTVRCWTIDAINCYNRNCICKGCPMLQLIKSTDKCQMKASVLELVKRHGIPKENGSKI